MLFAALHQSAHGPKGDVLSRRRSRRWRATASGDPVGEEKSSPLPRSLRQYAHEVRVTA